MVIKRKFVVKLIALTMALCVISAYSLWAAAENEEEFSEQSFVQESSYYYVDDEESSDNEESSYDYVDDEESSDDEEEESYYYSEPDDYDESSYYEPSYYEPSIYRETTEYYYDDEESVEPSSGYHEISVDSSELTSGDWDKLRERLSSEMKNKSSDNAIRDIKDSDSEHNDNIGYLVWGLVLIAMGLVLVGFVVYMTVYTKFS